jgi:hypothetical protein
MKFILVFTLALMNTAAMAKDITISGLKAKALYDTLAITKLEPFHDGGMGKSYINIGAIDCLKKVSLEAEMKCSFKSQDEQNSTIVNLISSEDYKELKEIRFALSEVTSAEITIGTEKMLKVKAVACKYSGYGHVMDSLEVEVKYDCTVTL